MYPGGEMASGKVVEAPVFTLMEVPYKELEGGDVEDDEKLEGDVLDANKEKVDELRSRKPTGTVKRCKRRTSHRKMTPRKECFVIRQPEPSTQHKPGTGADANGASEKKATDIQSADSLHAKVTNAHERDTPTHVAIKDLQVGRLDPTGSSRTGLDGDMKAFTSDIDFMIKFLNTPNPSTSSHAKQLRDRLATTCGPVDLWTCGRVDLWTARPICISCTVHRDIMGDRQAHPRLFRIGSRSSLRSSQDGGPSANDDAVSISSKASTDSLGNRISSKLKNFFSASNLKSHIRKHSLSVRHSSLSTEDLPSTNALSPEPSVPMSDPAYPSPSPSPDPPAPPSVPVFLPEVQTTRFSWLPERGDSPTINGTTGDGYAKNTPHSFYGTSNTISTTSSVSPSRTDTPYLAEPQPSTTPQVHSSLLNRQGSLKVPYSDNITTPPARVPSPRTSLVPSLRPKSISLDADGLTALLQQLPSQATPNEQLINLVASSLDPTFIASRRAALSKFEMFETATLEPTDPELELVKFATAGGAEIDPSSPSSSPPNLTNDPSSTSTSSTASSVEDSTQQHQQQFWVPAHAHPELHPTEFKQWIASHMEQGDGGAEGSGTTAAPKIDDGLGAMLTLSRKPLRRTKSFIERHVSITPDTIDLFADLESPIEEKEVAEKEEKKEEVKEQVNVPETTDAGSRNSFDFGSNDDDWATHSAVDHERRVKGLPPLKRGKIVKGKRAVPTMNRTPSTFPESPTDDHPKSIDTGEILEVQLPDPPADSNDGPTHHKKKKKKRRTTEAEVSELGLATLQTGEEEAIQRYEEMQRRAEALTNALAMAMPGPDPVKPITSPAPAQSEEKVSSSADSVVSDRSSIDTIRTYESSESSESSWSSKRPKKTSWSWLMNLIRPSNSSSSSTSSLSPSPPEITYYYPPEPSDETAGGYGPRYPLHVEKHIYAVSHMKLADQRRTLAEQVSISNLMLYIISVHADVTLKRRGPRRKKGKKKKKRRGMRELVSLEASGEAQQQEGDGVGAGGERMKDKHFREVFVGTRTSSLGQVQVQVQHVQQQVQQQYGGGSFSFEPTEQYRPVSNASKAATTSVPSVPVIAVAPAPAPATSASGGAVTYTYTRWTSGFNYAGAGGAGEDDFSGSDADSDSSRESDEDEGGKKWGGYNWGGNSSVAVNGGGGGGAVSGGFSPYVPSPIQISTADEEEEDDLVPLAHRIWTHHAPSRAMATARVVTKARNAPLLKFALFATQSLMLLKGTLRIAPFKTENGAALQFVTSAYMAPEALPPPMALQRTCGLLGSHPSSSSQATCPWLRALWKPAHKSAGSTALINAVRRLNSMGPQSRPASTPDLNAKASGSA
ncbi:hypothetical protein BJ742DRAFT_737931 [Cladochytrium replicatum]|nr:hypothetical protein BJ742DRAFT_737931 [Cladochytrium replicatum]